MPRMRNVAGYPSTALGVARRQARAAEQKARRLAMIAGTRVPRNRFSGMGAQKSRFAANAPERNFWDVETATHNVNTTGAIILLNQIATGAGQSNRVGRKIDLLSLQIRGSFYNSLGALHNDCCLAIVYDSRPGIVALTAAVILEIFETISPNAFTTDKNARRFKQLARIPATVLGDRNAGANLTSAATIWFDRFIKLKGLRSTYMEVGSGAMGDIETGALYAVFMGNNTLAGGEYAFCDFASRLRYTP